MAPLLQRILKALVVSTVPRLTSPMQVAKPPVGSLGAAHEEAEKLRDSFQAYLDNYFVSEAGGPSRASGSSPSSAGTSTPRRSERRPGTPERARHLRQDSGQLGWWRATVRHSRELAQICATICGRVAGLLVSCMQLQSAMAQLRTLDAMLLRDVEGFMQLHSGIRGGALAPADLLEPKRQMETQLKMAQVQERLSDLLGRCKEAGVLISEGASTEEDAPAGTSSKAEVLVLDDTPATTGPGLQDSINSLQEDLQEMGSELESFGRLIASKAAKHRFLPASRSEEPDSAAAREVARRSTWCREPPPVVPENVPVIEVQHSIKQRVITRCPSRPRTAQPALLRLEPPAKAADALGARPGTAGATCAESGSGSPAEQGEPSPPEAETCAEDVPSESPQAPPAEDEDAELEGRSEDDWPGASPACLWQVSADT